MLRRKILTFRSNRTHTRLGGDSLIRTYSYLRKWFGICSSYWSYTIIGRRLFRYSSRLTLLRRSFTKVDTLVHSSLTCTMLCKVIPYDTIRFSYRKRRSPIRCRRVHRYTYIKTKPYLDLFKTNVDIGLRLSGITTLYLYKYGRTYCHCLRTRIFRRLLLKGDSALLRWLTLYDIKGLASTHYRRIFRLVWSVYLRKYTSRKLHRSDSIRVVFLQKYHTKYYMTTNNTVILSTPNKVLNFFNKVCYDKSCYILASTLFIIQQGIFTNLYTNFIINCNILIRFQFWSHYLYLVFYKQFYTIHMALRQNKIFTDLVFNDRYRSKRYNLKKIYKYSKLFKHKLYGDETNVRNSIRNYLYKQFGVRNKYGYHSYLHNNQRNWFRWLLPTVSYFGILTDNLFFKDEIPFYSSLYHIKPQLYINYNLYYGLDSGIYRFNALDVYIYITQTYNKVYNYPCIYNTPQQHINLITCNYCIVLLCDLLKLNGVTFKWRRKLYA